MWLPQALLKVDYLWPLLSSISLYDITICYMYDYYRRQVVITTNTFWVLTVYPALFLHALQVWPHLTFQTTLENKY